MSLTSGSIIGHYEISALLGVGGMGEVYRARDTKLNREVALKVLPEPFAQDAERMARFQREAQILAALNHPGIATIYGLEESGAGAPHSKSAFVMELVEGPTLADRIAQGSLPLEEALPIARQIAEALEYAHEKGIIHRDLKPANVKISADGQVKLLDFGLAKALEPARPGSWRSGAGLTHSPTITSIGTQAGVILGSAAYMSPEQAKGKAVDRRADIWAFGVVLYEMLAGKRPFSGETVSETLAAVIRAEPDWSSLPAGTPARLQNLMRRCLDKDVRNRLRDIGEARILIEDGSADAMHAAASVTPSLTRSQLWVVVAITIILTAIVTALAVRLFPPAAEEGRLRKLFLTVPNLVVDRTQYPVISPDGRKIVYAAGGKLWLRELDRFAARELPGTAGPRSPFWSADSEWVAFSNNDGQLRKVSVSGGGSSMICQLPSAIGVGVGGGWIRDNRIVFTTGSSGLMQVSAQGGDPTPYLEADPEKDSDFHEASALPGGSGVLFLTHRKGYTSDTIEVVSSGRRMVLLQIPNVQLTYPVYSATGHILYERSTGTSGIWALPFSLSKLEATGEPFLVAQGGARPSVANDGTLIYTTEGSSLKQMARVDRKGEIMGLLGSPMVLDGPAFSPDGKRIAAAAFDSGTWNIWLFDLLRNSKIRLTFGLRVNTNPSWSPDGRVIVFNTVAPVEVWSALADGSGQEHRLVGGFRPRLAGASSPAPYIVFEARGQGNDRADIHFAPYRGPASAIDPKSVRAAVEGPANQEYPAISPWGGLLAYQSDESGAYQVWIRRFPDGEGQWRVSSDGGGDPRWSQDGRELFFRNSATNTLLVVEIQTGATVTLSAPQTLFSADKIGAVLTDGYDVAPDAKSFVVLINSTAGDNQHGIAMVQNWFAEFREKQKK